MGSDTGGSIRIPAAACGVVGFKPAFGQLSVEGVFPLSWSLDTVGPLAKSVDDTWVMWRTLHLASPKASDLPAIDMQGVRAGIPKPYFFEWLQPDVKKAVQASMAILRETGVQLIEIDWPLAAAARAAAFLINRVESASVHERVALHDPERFMLFGSELRLRVAAGLTIPAALYLRAIRAQRIVKASIDSLYGLHNIDALVCPTVPTTAVPADDLKINGTGLEETLGASWTRLTMPFNATGQPVLAMPCGFDSRGLPVGLQLIGLAGRELILFQIGQALEMALNLTAIRPPLLSQVIDSTRAESRS
jgi:aspartyl-tRNA(Asn)/glutamyl-tRNA(Gln) amidotransferase subunit A